MAALVLLLENALVWLLAKTFSSFTAYIFNRKLIQVTQILLFWADDNTAKFGCSRWRERRSGLPTVTKSTFTSHKSSCSNLSIWYCVLFLIFRVQIFWRWYLQGEDRYWYTQKHRNNELLGNLTCIISMIVVHGKKYFLFSDVHARFQPFQRSLIALLRILNGSCPSNLFG